MNNTVHLPLLKIDEGRTPDVYKRQVMIIYYKQLSEGYQDRRRFEIMKKVGMDDKETKSVIKTQILMAVSYTHLDVYKRQGR